MALTQEELSDRLFAARQAGHEYACVWCGAGVDEEGGGDHAPDCERPDRWTSETSACVDALVEFSRKQRDGCTAITGHGLDSYTVLVATAKNPRRLGELKAIHEAWYR